MNLTNEPRRRNKHPYQVIHRPDGSVEIILCFRGGVSRFFGDSEKDTLNRARSYEATLRHNQQQPY